MMVITKMPLNDILGVIFLEIIRDDPSYLFLPFLSWSSKTPWFWKETIGNSWRCSKKHLSGAKKRKKKQTSG
jgi:hypothetical protein